MSICQWPASERPREKLLSNGPDTLSNAELLAIFLRTGIRGRSAVDLARDLLSDFGNLRSLLNAEQQEFCKLPGLGPAKYAQLRAVLTLAKRELQEGLERGPNIENPQSAIELLSRHLRNRQQEVFCCLWLDTRHRIIELHDVFFGTINGASVYPREVVRAAMKRNAAAVILAHNHPSGIAEPSLADERLTKGLIDALNLIDVRVLDHIVVGDGEHVSFAQRGLL
ncbi:MAG: RadC family protein [Oceanococcus sp.]